MLFDIMAFIVTGGADRSIFDLSFIELLTNTDLQVSNPCGKLGAWVADMLVTNGVGIMSVSVSVVMIVIGMRILGVRTFSFFKFLLLTFLVTIWGSVTLGFIFNGLADDAYFLIGGAHGYYMSRWLTSSIGVVGTTLLIVLTLLIYMIVKVEGVENRVRALIEKLSKGHIRLPKMQFSGDMGGSFGENAAAQQIVLAPEKTPAKTAPDINQAEDVADEAFDISEKVEVAPKTDYAAQAEKSKDLVPADDAQVSDNFTIVENAPDEESTDKNLGALGTPYDPTLDLENYKFPTFDLLIDYEKRFGDDAPEKIEERHAELEANKNKIVETLDTFKIGVQKIEATIGPTVTLYEIVPVPGVKISRIQSLEDDIALSLAALCVRIIAPIPGKGTIGIEVPNSKPKIVSMLSVIKSSAYQKASYELPIVLGKTISNETYVFDLVKTPHLLVAGATGQGKSVGLNAIITSILYRKHPSQVKLVLIDPKMVEFSIYSKLEKHFLAKLESEEEAVITDVEKAKATLISLTQEMDDRYKLIKGIARNIKEYNEKFIRRELNPLNGHRFLPYIVVIIDEYADLIMTAGKDVEQPIARIAQKARAVGIHLVLATQRPSTNVVTGIIKANFPSRIAFKVTSMVDSRTVLDSSGAQHLIGRGDMLVSINGGATTRVQCALVDTDEVIAINDYISAQQGYACAFALPDTNVGATAEGFGAVAGDAPGAWDPMIAEAAEMIVGIQKGSTSHIQRGLSLGFNRAGRIMDQLERMGIVGPADGSKPRNVHVQTMEELRQVLQNFGVKS